jgi:hypothetical protein|uniref:Uncharacterized protein n=1 Tax=Zea mays TaxID=4577 RepID=A0A804LKU6_MAIZE
MHIELQKPQSAATSPRSPLHLVFVPFLERSHFAPLAAKAASSAAAGTEHEVAATTTAAIVTTAHFAALAPASVPVHAAPLRCPGGYEDFSLLPDDASAAPTFFAAAEAALAPALTAAIRAHHGMEAGLRVLGQGWEQPKTGGRDRGSKASWRKASSPKHRARVGAHAPPYAGSAERASKRVRF